MAKMKTGLRTRNIFDPKSEKPFRLSRSKFELFLNCPRCFYLDRRLGVSQPPGFPFNLNNAVDSLLKKEFDHYRGRGLPHPLMQKFGFRGVPYRHEKLDEWRDALRGGIEWSETNSGFTLTGGIDDLWLNEKEQICIVDYKATSKTDRPTIDAEWQISYRRQVEIYNYLFVKNGFSVSENAYFVYCNGLTNRNAFEGKLEFDIQILKHRCDITWIEKELSAAKNCLIASDIPNYSDNCDYCAYNRAQKEVLGQMQFAF